MPNVLFSAPAADWPVYEAHLLRACAALGLQVALSTETDRPDQVDYIVYSPDGPVQDFAPFTRLKAVLSLWAGVERIVRNPTLTVPLCRMVDRGLTEGMVEWVTGHVLRHHLGIDTHLTHQDGVWRHETVPPLARDRSIGILGLGALGSAVARTLASLNFPVHGWSARPKDIAGITTRSGPEGLAETLRRAHILVLLLPATPETESLLDADRLARLTRGAMILNPGRGSLIDDDALLAALNAGHIAHATLDVFRTEPLPAGHPYWSHPRVTVTPHIASETRPSTASETIALNIRRGEEGLPFLHTVDRARGY